DVEISRDVCGAVSRRGHPADDDELDVAADQNLEQTSEVGHRFAAPDRGTSSTKWRTEISFARRSLGVSFKFSRIRVRSTSRLYASMAGVGSSEIDSSVTRSPMA